jgi:hypothetical protein
MCWIFWRFGIRRDRHRAFATWTREEKVFYDRGNGMIGKKALGLVLVWVLALSVAAALPAAAAEETFQLNIPGCTA